MVGYPKGKRDRGSGRGIVSVGGVALLGCLVLGQAPAWGQPFVRGDVDGSGWVRVADAYWVIAHLFVGRSEEVLCDDAADADDSGRVDLTDAIFILNWLFRGGPAPAAPFPACGEDPTPDGLGCAREGPCPAALRIGGTDLGAPEVLVVLIDYGYDFRDLWDFERPRGEAARLIGELTEDTVFAVGFSGQPARWYPVESTVVRATPEHKAAALELLESPSTGECLHEALLSALGRSRVPDRVHRTVVCFSDGHATCQGAAPERYREITLERLPVESDGTTVIHVVAPAAIDASGRSFLRALAETNGGAYVQIDR